MPKPCLLASLVQGRRGVGLMYVHHGVKSVELNRSLKAVFLKKFLSVARITPEIEKIMIFEVKIAVSMMNK